MPGARLFLVLSLNTLAILAAIVVEKLAMGVVALDALLLLAFAVDLTRARGTVVEAHRTWPPMLVQGSAATVTLELATRAARDVTVLLREGLHPAVSDIPLRNRIVLPRGSAQTRWTYDLVPRRRGEHEIAALTIRVLGPWKLAWHQRTLLSDERRRVYPQVRWEGKVGQLLALAQRRQMGSMPLRFHGTGTEPYALREYLPGDPPTKVHWKATARHGRLVTREDTWERGARLMILLDVARAMTGSEGHGLERSKLDYSLAAALALARVAAARGDRVTLLAFSDRVERLVRVAAASRGLTEAYEALYDLEARFAEPAYDVAAEQAYELETRSATVVLFTSVVDLAAADLLRGALLRLERRHRPLLVNLQDPELQALATGSPDSPEEAFAQVATLEILLANRRLGRRLRRAGIRVVNAPADRLALDTLEEYLAMFRTRLNRARAG